MTQTYDNYFKKYRTTPEGRESVRSAQRRYKRRLAEKYGTSQHVAVELHKQALKSEKSIKEKADD